MTLPLVKLTGFETVFAQWCNNIHISYFFKSKTFAGTNPCYVSMSAGEIPVVEPAWGSVLVANADAGNHDWKNSSRYDNSRDLSVTTRRTDTVFDDVHRRRRWYFGGTKIATQIVSNSTFWPSVWLRRYLFFDMTIKIKKLEVITSI